MNSDWGEPVPTGNGRFGAIMENMLFLIDLPKYPQEYSKPRAELTFFGQELDRFLRHQNVPADIRDGLLRFDFSATAPYAFVHTMAGRHDGERWRHTGTPGLGRAVRELGLATDRQLEIEYVGSSLGQLDHHFVEGIYRAAQGDDGLKVCGQRTASRKSQAAEGSGDGDGSVVGHARAALPDLLPGRRGGGAQLRRPERGGLPVHGEQGVCGAEVPARADAGLC